MDRKMSAVDAAFANLNGGFDDALFAPPKAATKATTTNEGCSQQHFPSGPSHLLGWNVVTSGATMKAKDDHDKKMASQLSGERRQLMELQNQLARERRKKEKQHLKEVRKYKATLNRLKDKELAARTLRRPQKWERRNPSDSQRRRHELAKMLDCEFTSLRKPESLGYGKKKHTLEPVLQHWMPQFKREQKNAEVSQNELDGNMRRHDCVKKAVKRQRRMRMLNSTNFSSNHDVNMGKIKQRGRSQMEELGALMKQQNYTTTSQHDSLSKFVLSGGGSKKKGLSELDKL